ncbi:MAG: hypothetical protein ACKOWK_06420 [Micrococcales bacterium]
MIAPILIAVGSLNLFAVERHKLAAQQLARELVRIESRNDAGAREWPVAVGLVADDLGIEVNQIAYSVKTSGSLVHARVSLLGVTETAVMRVQK